MKNGNPIFILVAILLVVGVLYYAIVRLDIFGGPFRQSAEAPNATTSATSGNAGVFRAESVARAREELARQLSLDQASIRVASIEEEIWSNGCLGLPEPNEACMMALVPGFRIELEAGGKTYLFRSNASGTVLRLQK